MIKPNRKNKKKYQFNPIETQKHDISSGVSEDQHQEDSNVLKKLNSTSSKVRQQITSILANTNIFPEEIKDKAVLKQLLIRIVDDKVSISYNSMFAVNNIIRNDPTSLIALSELGILDAVASYLKKIPTIQNVKLARRVLEGGFLLIETILTSLSFDQLRFLETTQNMKYIVLFALESISSPFLHDCEIVFQVIAYICQYSKLRKVVGESNTPEEIFYKVTHPIVKALLSSILLFSKSELSQKTLDQIADFINDTIDGINLELQYKSNILQDTKETKEEEIDMEAQINDKEEEMEEIDQQKVIEITQSQEPITNQIFLESLEALEIVSNLLLSLVEENEQQQDAEDNEEITDEQEPAINGTIASQLKQKLKCTVGILRNSGLPLNEGQVLVEQSWRIIRNTLDVFNQEELLKRSIQTLEAILQNKLPFNHELLLSITETSLEIVYKIWKKHPESIKIPFSSLIQLTSFDILSKAGNKSVALVFDLVSLKYNPQEQPVSQNQNTVLGANLRDFLMKSESVELQCQCLDTVFSVYSNQNLDTTFKSLGYMELLSQGLQALNSYKHKTKFTKVVMQDLIRFIEYKRQKLSEQKLL